MRKLILIFIFIATTVIPVSALSLEPPEVPSSGEYYMPEDTESFADGLWYVIKSGISAARPDLSQAAGVCLSLLAIILLISVVNSTYSHIAAVTELVGVIAVSTTLLTSTNTLIHLGAGTVTELNLYGKLLLPVMTGAVAIQGGASTSAVLYTGTVFFSTLLNTVISKILLPLIYIYICLCIVSRAIQDDTIGRLRKTAKNTSTWVLKTILYIFTGYMTITGVVSGTTDAAALKAAKLTISGAVPIVGNILSDASEAVIVSTGVLKNAVGVYGLLAILAVWIGPFLKIGAHYLLLKVTSSICDVFGSGRTAGLIQDFSGVMGLLLAMIGTECLLLLISTVCFMRGVM